MKLGLVLAFALALGAAAASFATYAAWEHNPQGEFHDDDGVHLGNLLPITASWFIAFAGPGSAVAFAAFLWARRRR